MDTTELLEFTPLLRKEFVSKRLGLGLSYSALGRFLGVSWATIRKWELGETRYCLRRHEEMVRKFLAGKYDSHFQGGMDSTNIQAYLQPVPLEAMACVQRLIGSFRLLNAHPEISHRLLQNALASTDETLRNLLEAG